MEREEAREGEGERGKEGERERERERERKFLFFPTRVSHSRNAEDICSCDTYSLKNRVL